MQHDEERLKQLIKLAVHDVLIDVIEALDASNAGLSVAETVLSKRQIMSRLVEQGSSLRQFALRNGYNERSVLQAVDRWAGKHDLPRGRLTFAILKTLSNAVGGDVVEGIREAA